MEGVSDAKIRSARSLNRMCAGQVFISGFDGSAGED